MSGDWSIKRHIDSQCSDYIPSLPWEGVQVKTVLVPIQGIKATVTMMTTTTLQQPILLFLYE